MRKVFLPLLLAGAAASPALAAPDDGFGGFQARDERQQARTEARDERQQARSERREARQEPSTPKSETVQVRARTIDGSARADADAHASHSDVEAIHAARAARRDSADSVRSWRMDERRLGRRAAIEPQGRRLTDDTGVELRRNERERPHPGAKVVMAPGGGETLRQSDRPLPRVLRNRVPVVSSAPREDNQPPLRLEGRPTSPARWRSDWRRDHRYDWSSWRNRHRSLFRLGSYYDPFGWSYRRHSVGWRLWPTYYSSRYWLDDPWQYRLPYAPPGYRWIRYYDDAVLVDTWDGRVVDVIYNFFW